MGGSSKFDGGGRGRGGWLKSVHGGSMRGRLKMLSKNACDRVHSMVKLLALSSWKGALRFSLIIRINNKY